MIAMGATLYAVEVERQEAKEAAGDSGEKGMSQAKDVDESFARYQSIIDRQPFGPPPPGFDPTQPPGKGGAGGGEEDDGGKTEAEISAEEQKLMSSVRVSILNVTPSGAVMAGFTDSTTQPPVNYYLKVGDTSTDAAKWTVKDADPSAGTVTLSKDGIDVTLSVGGETKKGATAGKGGAKGPRVAADDQQRVRGLMRKFPMPPQAAAGGPAGGLAGDAAGEDEHGGSLARLRQRRMMRQAAEVAQRQAAEKARADIEAQEKAEREREREQAAAEREQQREALLQIQEELRRQREAKDAAKKAEEQQDEETND
jgi:hypothetical protein